MKANETGRRGEMEAAAFLRRKGYDILSANYRTRLGEIDLIASDGVFLVFAEVKTRSARSAILPREAVNIAKQRKIISAAGQYLADYPTELQPRFDVIEVTTDGTADFRVRSVRHIPNAFML